MAAAGNYARSRHRSGQSRQLPGHRGHRAERHPLGRVVPGPRRCRDAPRKVHNARYTDDKRPFVGPGNGTSFAVAHLAAAAALWLAQHGRDKLIARYGARKIQAAFLAVLRWPGVCVVPPGWPAGWGSDGWICSIWSPHPCPTCPSSTRWTPSAPPPTTPRAGSRTRSTPIRFGCGPGWPNCSRSPTPRTRRAAGAPRGRARLPRVHRPEFASAVTSTAETSAVRPAVDTAGVSTSLAEVLSA